MAIDSMLLALLGGVGEGYTDWSQREQDLQRQLKILSEQQKFAKSQAKDQRTFQASEAKEQRALQERLAEQQTKRLMDSIKSQFEGQKELQKTKLKFESDMKILDDAMKMKILSADQKEKVKDRAVDLVKMNMTWNLGAAANERVKEKIAILDSQLGLDLKKYLSAEERAWAGLNVELGTFESQDKARKAEAEARKVQANAMSLQAKTAAGKQYYEERTQEFNFVVGEWEKDIANASGDEKKRLARNARKGTLSILAALNRAKTSINKDGMVDPKKDAELDFVMSAPLDNASRLEFLNERSVRSGDITNYQKSIKSIGGENIYEELAKPEPIKPPGFLSKVGGSLGDVVPSGTGMMKFLSSFSGDITTPGGTSPMGDVMGKLLGGNQTQPSYSSPQTPISPNTSGTLLNSISPNRNVQQIPLPDYAGSLKSTPNTPFPGTFDPYASMFPKRRAPTPSPVGNFKIPDPYPSSIYSPQSNRGY